MAGVGDAAYVNEIKVASTFTDVLSFRSARYLVQLNAYESDVAPRVMLGRVEQVAHGVVGRLPRS